MAELLLITGLAFLAGGVVKGVIGIGLPLVTVPILATFVDPVRALALMFVPAIAANVMQAYQAGLSVRAARRFWPALLGVGLGAVAGSTFLAGTTPRAATLGLAVVVILFCLSQLLHRLPPVPPAGERWFTPLAGLGSGVAGGLTGFFGLTLVPYLLALRLGREEFVATIAMLYLCGVGALYVNLWRLGVLDARQLGYSLAAAAPTLAGVWLGSRVRRRTPEALFRRLLIGLLLVMAINLLRKALTEG